MDAAALEQWQGTLPTDRDELGLILEHLQAEWLKAQTDLIPAIRHGTGAEIQAHVTTLSWQLHTVETLLTRADR
ncbi:hypothetical protein E7T09_08420 [Deinococcus sp. KSM4-11]|uniref:hypothetical protein n=1 Tax=Deinococcus sp. KSM4-11 TaxID=2568654 RepID=UPI0010A586AD|nr:hypothetical protein [Deinococcus sp. KSM4-11]THF87171.1 hypothetical protein E7T09_08420 [Deinococcus sp. KSM4-11]